MILKWTVEVNLVIPNGEKLDQGDASSNEEGGE